MTQRNNHATEGTTLTCDTSRILFEPVDPGVDVHEEGLSNLHLPGTASQEAVRWFALYVKSHHEKAVARSLRGKAYTEFLPLYRARNRRGGRFQNVDLPLFPNYVFCRFQPSKRLPILQTPGVFHVIGTGKGPEAIPDSEIKAIQKIVASGLPAQPWPFLHAGDRVRIVEGPLQGCEGTVEKNKGQYRLLVSISMLQRSIAVDVDRQWVRPITRPRLILPPI